MGLGKSMLLESCKTKEAQSQMSKQRLKLFNLRNQSTAEDPLKGTSSAPLSSQSLVAPLEWTEDAVEDTEDRLTRPNSLGSFFTKPPLHFGLREPTRAPLGAGCFLALFPARSSSKRRGRGRKWVRSYSPHLLQTIFPGLRVERRHEGGSVVWQLKHLRRRY